MSIKLYADIKCILIQANNGRTIAASFLGMEGGIELCSAWKIDHKDLDVTHDN